MSGFRQGAGKEEGSTSTKSPPAGSEAPHHAEEEEDLKMNIGKR